MGLGSGRSLQLKLWQSLQNANAAQHMRLQPWYLCFQVCSYVLLNAPEGRANTAHTHTQNAARREVRLTCVHRPAGAPPARARGGGGRAPRPRLAVLLTSFSFQCVQNKTNIYHIRCRSHLGPLLYLSPPRLGQPSAHGVASHVSHGDLGDLGDLDLDDKQESDAQADRTPFSTGGEVSPLTLRPCIEVAGDTPPPVGGVPPHATMYPLTSCRLPKQALVHCESEVGVRLSSRSAPG